MTSLYLWLKYIHILAGFLFLMAHGTAVFVAFQLKKETDPERMKALLDISSASWPTMVFSLLVLLISGVANAFLLHLWGQVWVWVSLVLLLGLSIWMYFVGQQTYHPLRKILGLPYMAQGKQQVPETPRPLAEIKAAVAKSRPIELTVVGLVGFALILWLMIFKPF